MITYQKEGYEVIFETPRRCDTASPERRMCICPNESDAQIIVDALKYAYEKGII